MLNVLLIEDDIDLADTVCQYLELEEIRCDLASNGVAGLNLAGQNSYAVILLDLNLPRLDGISLCRRLRQQGNDTPVLMLTARDSLDEKEEGFRAGTDDYLVKPFELRELVMRVLALSRRRSGQVNMLRCGDLEMNLTARTVQRRGRELKLSPTGWKILEALLRASPAVLSKMELEEAVWGEDLPDSDSLKVHLYHLRKAIDGAVQDSHGAGKGLIQTVPGHGFVLRNDRPDGSGNTA